MEYQQLLIPFCFYSLIILSVQQSQLTGFSYAGQHVCAPDDAFYLLQFKKGLTIGSFARGGCDNEARAKTLSWNVTGDCCKWDGVTCDGFTGHVIGLDLSCSFLSGTINANSSLSKLGHLQRLNLAYNDLVSFPLGNGISELTSLTHLYLSYAAIVQTNEIPPGLFKLPKNFSSSLTYLDLQGTHLFGDISDSNLFHLPNLQVLRLGWNYFLTGTLPNFNWSFSGTILELDFFETGIFGKVPDSIGNLHSLRYLNVSNCHLSGSIPESIGNLTAIRELKLSDNNFTGNVPSTISKLNNLISFDLSSNHFGGSIPESIGNLTAIRELALSYNNFTGNVPSTISKLNKLISLDISSNHFGGSIPESIGNFTRITSLDLSNNSFSGNVPSTVGKLNKLSSLSLFSNYFEGSIPDIFANLSELSYLYFDTNNFTGSFPYSIATLTRLEVLHLHNNLLTGTLPSNISGLQELRTLDLSFNNFTGTAPPWLFNLPLLPDLHVQANQLTKLPNEIKSDHLKHSEIDLSHNKLHGKIPDWMLSMTVGVLDLSHNFLTGFEKQVWRSMDLFYLNLENNSLQGSLHPSICDMITHLRILNLAHNNFSGSIPSCLGSSPLAILDLQMNNFHGEIPRFLPTGLKYLSLRGNQLGGQVPRSLVNCTDLEALDLGNNKINDTFPVWLEKLPNLQIMILKSNLFHGPIGELVSEFPFPELRIFDLSFNGFVGTLPSNFFKKFRGMMDVDEEKTGITQRSDSIAGERERAFYHYHVSLVIKEIAKLHELEALDLSWNRLIGEIPGQLSSLTFLEVLNLSYNHLVGRIPLGKQFNSFPIDSYSGNPDLCGFPLSKECGANNESDESSLEQDDDDDSSFASGFTWQAVVIGYGCGMPFGLFMGSLMFILGKPKWFVNFAEDITQQIAARKRRRQRKRHQRR
ncbi:receptor-like protein 53 isoform X2 [Lycium barbarum]|uniref:receptor-like protein 53 isoform X2 n=1 Tax=Lycium barbarum TaxID=112863 RepID=UPI00293EAF93|nr:receptor-like protein 53 isoform X2 [Lycium barbarum]